MTNVIPGLDAGSKVQTSGLDALLSGGDGASDVTPNPDEPVDGEDTSADDFTDEDAELLSELEAENDEDADDNN